MAYEGLVRFAKVSTFYNKYASLKSSMMLKNEYVACEGCALGKMHIDEFPANPDRRKRYILERVHTDVCGSMHIRSLGGAYYFLFFIDHCTRYTWVYLLRKKSDVF